MIPQSKGKMYVADERGVIRLPWFISHNTFNFGSYRHAHKIAFERLYVLNDEVLAPSHSVTLNVEEDTTMVLVPLIGAVTFNNNNLGNESCVVAGAVQLFNVVKNTTIQFTNPYNDEVVNFLQLWIKVPQVQPAAASQVAVDLDGNINQLPSIIQNNDIVIAIGKFEGRQEGVYQVAQKGNAVFVFVIDGHMEVQYRLLHSRDGLGLWDVNEIEFEALSASAIVLFIEVPVASV